MKKLLALLAVVLCVVSCQTEPEGLDVNVGGEIDAIVNVTIPEVETRAAGGNDSALGVFDNGVLAGNATMRYILQVYYNGEPSQERLVKYSDGKSVAFDVRLVPGRQYTMVAWADVVNGEADVDNHYVTKDANGKSTLDNITLNGEWNAMDESRDAFTATSTSVFNSSNVTLDLKRPFAKLRVVTTDVEALENLGIEPAKAVATYTTPYRASFNAVAGTAATAGTVTKTHTFDLAAYGDNTDVEMVLFTDYFFAESDIVKFDLDIQEADGTSIRLNSFNTDINVKRNYLTTIKGNILTGSTHFEVNIEDTFAGEYNYIQGDITLTEDLVINTPLFVRAGTSAVIDLNGHDIINNTKTLTYGEGEGIVAYGELTIKGEGTVKGSTRAVWARGNNGAVINIYGGNFEGCEDGYTGGGNSVIYASSGNVINIYGGTFKALAQDASSYADTQYPVLNVADNNGMINVYGGTFYGQNPAAPGTEPAAWNATHPNGFVAEGCYSLEYETGVYTVQAFDPTARTLTINSKEEFMKLNALNANWAKFFSNGQGTTYSDYAAQNGGKGTDFYYKWDWTIKLNVDIDLAGETFTAPVASFEGFGYFDGQNHTIKNATIENTSEAGLFNATHCGLKNINLNNIVVKGGNNGNAGILTSDCHKPVNNITITNSSVVGGKYTGGVVGYGYCDVTNCVLKNCIVKGCYKCGGVIGYVASSDGESNVTGNTLTNCTVTDAGEHTPGKSEYVIGKVVGNYNCNGSCVDNVVENMTTSAIALIGKIEAGCNVEGFATTVDSFNAALSDNTADVIEVAANLNMGTTGVGIERDVTLNFNNYDVTSGGGATKNESISVFGEYNVEVNNANITGGSLMAYYGANMELNNVSLTYNYTQSGRNMIYVASDNDKQAVAVIDGGNYTMTGGSGNRYVCAHGNAIVYIKGGNFSGKPDYSTYAPFEAVNIGSYTAQIIISGGTFNFDPSKETHGPGATVYPSTSTIADGYKVVNNGNGTWSVVAE